MKNLRERDNLKEEPIGKQEATGNHTITQSEEHRLERKL